MMKVLFIASKSIYTCAAQTTLLEIITTQKEKGNEVGILMIHDATLACRKGGTNIIATACVEGIKVYAQKEDLRARGIIDDKVCTGIEQVDYDRSINLIMDEYEKVITWC